MLKFLHLLSKTTDLNRGLLMARPSSMEKQNESFKSFMLKIYKYDESKEKLDAFKQEFAIVVYNVK